MIEYTITARCDGCGVVLDHDEPIVTMLPVIRWEWLRKWKARGILVRERYLRPALLYCPACADGHLKPAPHKSRAAR